MIHAMPARNTDAAIQPAPLPRQRRGGAATRWMMLLGGATLGTAFAAAAYACRGAAAPGDSLAAVHHLLSSGTLYRFGFAVDVIALTCLL